MTTHDDELTHEESEALRALADGPATPPDLERSTLERLESRGLLRGRRPSLWKRSIPAAAAGILLFAAGLWLGSMRQAPDAEGQRFALLLFQSPLEHATPPDVEASRVAEYIAWARSLEENGRTVTGEKLDDPRRLVAPAAAGPIEGDPIGVPVNGFFIVTADNLEEALGLARTCPHLKYGGVIEVRPVAGT